MNRRQVLLMFRLGAMAFLSFVARGSSGDNPGFPAVAVESFAKRIPTLRETLKKFAGAEHLNFFEGEFPKRGRTVTQFYLKHNNEPAFVISNFLDPLKFAVAAYSSQPEQIWSPRWRRLLTALGSVTIEPRE